MKPKKKTLEFTLLMINFYFLSSSLVNWFNGLFFVSPVFYMTVLVVCLLCLTCIVKIIKEPHIVKNKDTNAPLVLIVFGVAFSSLLIPGLGDFEDWLMFGYFLSTILSMALLIKWYKVTGVELKEKPVETKVVEQKPKEEDKLTDLEKLRVKIREALNITPTGTDAYRHLIHSEQLVNEIIADKIDGPKNIISQMTAVIDHYEDLVSRRIKTTKIVNTLNKLEGTLKMVEDTLIQIYDVGIDSQINEIETDSETFEKLVELEGLRESDFKLDK